MIVGSTKEDLSLEKRVSITPETAKNIINLGLKIYIEINYAAHIGIQDSVYKSVGVEIKNSSNEVEFYSKLIKKNKNYLVYKKKSTSSYKVIDSYENVVFNSI